MTATGPVKAHHSHIPRLVHTEQLALMTAIACHYCAAYRAAGDTFSSTPFLSSACQGGSSLHALNALI